MGDVTGTSNFIEQWLDVIPTSLQNDFVAAVLRLGDCDISDFGNSWDIVIVDLDDLFSKMINFGPEAKISFIKYIRSKIVFSVEDDKYIGLREAKDISEIFMASVGWISKFHVYGVLIDRNITPNNLRKAVMMVLRQFYPEYSFKERE